MAEEAAESAGPAEQTEPAEGSEETRRRFREALERKKRENHHHNEQHDAGGKGVGHSQVLSGRRQFRRKSG
jgi:hypothetical protein